METSTYSYVTGGTYGLSSSTSVGDNLALFSVSFWVKATSTVNKIVIAKAENIGNGAGWALFLDGSGVLYGQLQTAGGAAYEQAKNTTSVVDGAWHNVVMVRDGVNHIIVYVDGVAGTDLGGAGTCTSISNASPISLANDAGIHHVSISGSFDDIILWNVALSAPNVASIFTASLPQPGSVIAHWSIEAGSGLLLADPVGSDDITMGGGSWSADVPTPLIPTTDYKKNASTLAVI